MLNLPEQLRGVKVFPIIPNGKTPIIPAWQKVCSDDPEQIAAWISQYPGCNWGIPCGQNGLLVYDIDLDGIDWWKAKAAELGETVSTLTIRTPKGGYHYYFRGQGRSSSRTVANGVDTRGGIPKEGGGYQSSGYVVAPGSHTDASISKCATGDYKVIESRPISPLPAELLNLVPERKKSASFGLSKNPDFDQPRNINWATDLLQNYVLSGRVAVEGQGGDNLTYQVVASVLDKAISPATAFDLIWEYWNPHCSPPWEDWEIEQKIVSALTSGEDTKSGAKGLLSNDHAFTGYEGYKVEEPASEKQFRYRPMWLRDARKDTRPARWLIPGYVPADGTGILYGRFGSYKTFIALDWALCLASGVQGQWAAAPGKHTVLFLAGERSYSLQEERTNAWCARHGVNPEDITFVLIRGVPAYNDSDSWMKIREMLREMEAKPDFIVIDTLARLNVGAPENDNDTAKEVVTFMEEMAEYYGCFVMAIGHTGKDESRGLRGADAYIANTETAYSLKKTAEGVRLTVERVKDSDPGDPVYLKAEQLENSIILVKTDKLDETAKRANGSQYSWAGSEEIIRILQSNDGIMGHELLCQEIAGKYGIDRRLVSKRLKSAEGLEYLRNGNEWAIPYQEYDL